MKMKTVETVNVKQLASHELSVEQQLYYKEITEVSFSRSPSTGTSSPLLAGLKGTVSRDSLYSIFFIDHILLVLLEVLYEDFKFRRIFAVLFNQKGH